MIFVESQNYTNDFKNFSKEEFESSDLFVKIKSMNYLRQLVRDVIFQESEELLIEKLLDNCILNEKNILFFIKHLIVKYDNSENLNVQEITRFNLIVEKCFLKIIELILKNKLLGEDLEIVLDSLLNNEKFLKIFLKTIYNQLNYSKQTINEKFIKLFGALKNVKYFLIYKLFKNLFEVNANFLNIFKIHFVDNFLLDLEHLRKYDYILSDYDYLEKNSKSNEEDTPHLNSKDKLKNEIENQLQSMFRSFYKIISDDSSGNLTQSIFAEIAEYVKKFFEKFDIQIVNKEDKNENMEDKFLKKKRGRPKGVKVDPKLSKINRNNRFRKESETENSQEKVVNNQTSDDLQNHSQKKIIKKGSKVTGKIENKPRNKKISYLINNSGNKNEGSSQSRNCESALIEINVHNSEIKRNTKLYKSNIEVKSSRNQNLKNKENLENTKRSTLRRNNESANLHKQTTKEKFESPIKKFQKSRSNSPYVDLSDSSSNNRNTPIKLNTHSIEKYLPNSNKRQSSTKNKDFSQPKKERNSQSKQTTPVKRKLTPKECSSKSSKKSPSRNLKLAEETLPAYNIRVNNKSKEKYNSNNSSKQITPIKLELNKIRNSRSTSGSPIKQRKSSPKPNSIISNFSFKNRSESPSKLKDKKIRENSSNQSRKSLSEKRSQVNKAISPSKFEITPIKSNTRSSRNSAKSHSFGNIKIEEIDSNHKNKKTSIKSSNEKKDLTISSKKHFNSKKSFAGSNKSKKSEKFLGRKRIAFNVSDKDVAFFDSSTPVKEMRSKSKIDSNHKSSITPSKSILYKKNFFLDESIAKKNSVKKKRVEIETKTNTRANKKIGKI